MTAGVGRTSTPPALWAFVCPDCRHDLAPSVDSLHCPQCRQRYAFRSGIWRFLPEGRARVYRRFLHEYHTIRHDQGWGRRDPAYFRALPVVARNDPQWEIWRRRAQSSDLVLTEIIGPAAERSRRPQRVLDLGAGNCWFSYRLATLGHQVAAIDISDDPVDGIGAHAWYSEARGETPPEDPLSPPVTPVQAEFDRLPFPNCSADVIVFNGSFHYSREYGVTVRESLRVLSPEGIVVIMDTPVYRDATSGATMVEEREGAFERAYGFRSNSVQAEHFLTPARLDQLAGDHAVTWRTVEPVGRMGMHLRRQMTGRWRELRGRRELATMPVIILTPDRDRARSTHP